MGVTEQTTRQNVRDLRIDLVVENNTAVLTETVITLANVCSQRVVMYIALTPS